MSDPDRRQAMSLFMRPSIKQAIDLERGALTRSAWVEQAIVGYLIANGRPLPRTSRPLPLNIRDDRSPAQRAADGDQ